MKTTNTMMAKQTETLELSALSNDPAFNIMLYAKSFLFHKTLSSFNPLPSLLKRLKVKNKILKVKGKKLAPFA